MLFEFGRAQANMRRVKSVDLYRMSLVTECPGEAGAATRTLKGLFARVGEHVSLEVAARGDHSPTDGAAAAPGPRRPSVRRHARLLLRHPRRPHSPTRRLKL